MALGRFTLSMDGTVALVSALAAMMAGMAAVASTLQVSRMSKSQAQGAIFERRLQACMDLVEVASDTADNNQDRLSMYQVYGPDYDAEERKEISAEGPTKEADFEKLQKTGLRIRALFSGEPLDDTMRQVLEAEVAAYNTDSLFDMGGLKDSGKFSKQLETEYDKLTTLMKAANTQCRTYIREVARGERVVD